MLTTCSQGWAVARFRPLDHLLACVLDGQATFQHLGQSAVHAVHGFGGRPRVVNR